MQRLGHPAGQSSLCRFLLPLAPAWAVAGSVTANGSSYVTGPGNRLLSDGTYCYQYDAYGNLLYETNPAIDCLFGFTGFTSDIVTGFEMSDTRPYDPHTGIWAQEDRIGFNGHDENLNRYCGNGSTVRKDSTGEAWWNLWIADAYQAYCDWNWSLYYGSDIDRERRELLIANASNDPGELSEHFRAAQTPGPSDIAGLRGFAMANVQFITIAAGLVRPTWAYSAGGFTNWCKNTNKTGKMLTPAEADAIIAEAQRLGVSVRLDPAHPGTSWDAPHLNLGNANVPLRCRPAIPNPNVPKAIRNKAALMYLQILNGPASPNLTGNPLYRGTHRAVPSYCDDVSDDHEINTLFFWYLVEGGEEGVVLDVAKALRFARLWNERLPKEQQFEVVEVAKADGPTTGGGALLGFDIATGLGGYSLLAGWGSEVPRIKDVPEAIWELCNLLRRFYTPQFNENGLFPTYEQAGMCLRSMIALQTLWPGLYESGDLSEFQVIRVYLIGA